MLNNNDQYITTQLNTHIGLDLLHEWNAERLQVQSTSVVDFNSTNMLKVSTITLYHVLKVTMPFTDTSVKKHLWQLHVLVLVQTWTFCGGKEKICKTLKILFTTDKNCKWRLCDVTQCSVRQYYSK